jgi:hypothetical protein
VPAEAHLDGSHLDDQGIKRSIHLCASLSQLAAGNIRIEYAFDIPRQQGQQAGITIPEFVVFFSREPASCPLQTHAEFFFYQYPFLGAGFLGVWRT